MEIWCLGVWSVWAKKLVAKKNRGKKKSSSSNYYFFFRKKFARQPDTQTPLVFFTFEQKIDEFVSGCLGQEKTPFFFDFEKRKEETGIDYN